MPGYVVINPRGNKAVRWVSANNRGGMPDAFRRAIDIAARFANKKNIEAIAVVASIATIPTGKHVSDLFFFGGPYVMVDEGMNVSGHHGMPPGGGRYQPEESNPRMKMTNPSRVDTNGLHIQYLPVNQAWALMWYGTVLRIFNSKKEAHAELADLLTHTEHAVEKYGSKMMENPPAHRTGARLHPNLRYWQRAYEEATGQPGKVSAVFPWTDNRGNLAIFVRVKHARGFDTWSPYWNQSPDPADVKAATNDPDGWIAMMEGATEWEKQQWFQE